MLDYSKWLNRLTKRSRVRVRAVDSGVEALREAAFRRHALLVLPAAAIAIVLAIMAYPARNTASSPAYQAPANDPSVELILGFESEISFRGDDTMEVFEKLTVRALGNQIKAGIIRELPNRVYWQKMFTDPETQPKLSYSILQAFVDGIPTATSCEGTKYHQIASEYGRLLCLWFPEDSTTSTEHTISLQYEVHGLPYDTGAGREVSWPTTPITIFPVAAAKISVRLPERISLADITETHDLMNFGIRPEYRDKQVSGQTKTIMSRGLIFDVEPPSPAPTPEYHITFTKQSPNSLLLTLDQPRGLLPKEVLVIGLAWRADLLEPQTGLSISD